MANLSLAGFARISLVVAAASVIAGGAAAQEFQPPYSGFSDTATTFPFGAALDGIGVVVSAGHGWEGGVDGSFQRSAYEFDGCGTCDGITEDVYNAELVTDHLIPMLRSAGARVYVVRQPDRNPVAVEMNDGDIGYSETGAWADGANVELGWLSDYRTHSVAYPGTATWSLNVPVEGDYWVQARWAAGTNRCPTVRYTVHHAGGAAEFIVNQQHDGSMWVHLGRLHFMPGPVDITVDTPDGASCYLIADAVRLGGGLDDYSGHPWWHVGALQWLESTGPAAMSTYNEVTVRPALANAIGADYFISWHADASDDSGAAGTSTYRYNCGTDVWYVSMDPAECDLPVGSAEIQYAIQDRFITDVRTDWDSTWNNRGKLVGNYGELRPLSGIPGVIFESAFFTNTVIDGGARMSDNQAMHDPRFREIAARAVVRALITATDPTAAFPPDPPTHVVVRDAGGFLRASWRAPAGAAGYRVYVARDGRGYDNGRFTSVNSLDIRDFEPGSVALIRVTALGAGGESRPTGAVAASLAQAGDPPVLLVNAFDRLDAWVREDFNHRDYSFEHGMALASSGTGFDGAADEAVVAGDIDAGDYLMTDWILGRESSAHETFDPSAQAVVLDFIAGGGCMVASGTEIAWDLDHLGSTDDKAFIGDAFGAAFAADDAATRSVSADPAGPFASLSPFTFDDGSHGVYDARYPDVLSAAGGSAVAALRYSTGGVAAVAFSTSSGRSLLAGFPFETVVGPDARAALMSAVVDYCGIGEIQAADEPDIAEHAEVVEENVGSDTLPTADDGPGDVIEPEVVSGDAGADSIADDVWAMRDVPNDPDGADAAWLQDVAAGDQSGDRGMGIDSRADLSWLTDLAGGGADGGDGNGGGGGCTAGRSGAASPYAVVIVLILAVFAAASTCGRRKAFVHTGRPPISGSRAYRDGVY